MLSIILSRSSIHSGTRKRSPSGIASSLRFKAEILAVEISKSGRGPEAQNKIGISHTRRYKGNNPHICSIGVTSRSSDRIALMDGEGAL